MIFVMPAVRLAKGNGAKVILITSYANTPLSKLADIVLCGAGREVNYRSEATASRLVHLALMDLIYTALMLRDPDRFTNNMRLSRDGSRI